MSLDKNLPATLHKDTHEQNNVKYADDDRIYYLNLPHLVVGSLTSFPKVVKVLDDNRIIEKEIIYNQTLTKQIDEAIQNSIDENTRTHGDFSKNIKIAIDQHSGWITVSDDGRGIRVDDLSYVLAFTKFKTSSNFKFLDDENKGTDRTTIGAHGIGNKVINLFSSESQITSVTTDGNRGILITKNNMEIIEHKEDKAPKSISHGITTKFKPDFTRLEIVERDGKIISDDLVNHVHALLINIAYSNPQITFTFQGRLVKARSFSEFCRYYSEHCLPLFENDNISLAVFPSDGHKFVHIVNSLDLNKGGTILSYVTNTIVSKFLERLPKSYKITTSDIKTKIGIVLVLKGMKNLRFGSGQTKEELTNNLSELGLPTFDYTTFADKIFKYKPIKDPIVLLHQVLAEMEKRKALDSIRKDKKKERVSGHIKAINEFTFLNISEGLSPQGLLMGILPRSNNGFYGLTGLFTNVQKASDSQISKNKVISDLVNILNIDIHGNNKELTYKNVIISSDSDSAGTVIAGLLLAFFNKYAPDFIKNGGLKRNVLPLMIAFDKKGEVAEVFKYFREFVKWKENNDESKYEIKYYKGLASFDPSLVKKLFSKYGQEYFVETYIHNGDTTNELLNNWFNVDTIEWRKNALLSAPELDIGIA
jgi:DNA gyrase/topoisomerase IV subunit B